MIAPFGPKDLLDVSCSRSMTAAAEASERKVTRGTRAPEASLESLASDAGDRNPSPACFPVQGSGKVIWEANCCATHKHILA
jgi:hypothetical protein